MDDLLQRLEAIVTPAHLLAGEGASAFAVDGRQPEAVVFPGTVQEVSAVLAVCHETRAAVAPWGGGTAMGLGRPPDRLRVVLGTRRLCQLLDHEPADMTSTVQAGMPLLDYQAALGKNGQRLALDPPRAEHATLGGVLATNASGPRRARYGTLRDQVIGLRVVAADGTVTRAGAKVVKNVTGYDLNKLYVGSLGTLGVIVEASFRLYPLPADERTWLGRFPGIPAACDAVARILDSALVPGAIELLDAAAIRPLREVDAAPQPGAWLAVSVESVSPAVAAQLAVIAAIGRESGAAGELILDGQAQERLWRVVGGIAPRPGGLAVKVSLPPGAIPGACELAASLAERSGLGLRLVAEAGSGVLRCFLDPDAEGGASGLADVVAPLRSFALGVRGSLVVLEAPPDLKARLDVWGPVGDAFPIMLGLKQAFDPAGILNPGRFVGGI
jgi:glycolate oxidase FAD binding subunit